jgi:hypothetical protein
MWRIGFAGATFRGEKQTSFLEGQSAAHRLRRATLSGRKAERENRSAFILKKG